MPCTLEQEGENDGSGITEAASPALGDALRSCPKLGGARRRSEELAPAASATCERSASMALRRRGWSRERPRLRRAHALPARAGKKKKIDVENNGMSPDNGKTRLNPTYAHTQGVSGAAGSRVLFFSILSVALLH